MTRFDPGMGEPWGWGPADIATVLGCSLTDVDEAYATMNDDDWIAYCLEVYRAIVKN